MRNNRVLCFLLAITVLCQNTAAVFEHCDHVYNVNPGYSYLQSPDYPYYYPPNTSCRYTFIAPKNHDITLNCTIDLTKGANGCSTEFFYLSNDGIVNLTQSEQFCGYGTFIRKSLFRSVVVAYISYGATGYFECSLYVKKQPCDCGWSVNTKIVNGQETSINEYPSMVALQDMTSNMPVYCSAVIISDRYLLTAAHCIRAQPKAAYIRAFVGRHNLQSTPDTQYSKAYYISKIIQHPNYTQQPPNNDIALMKTSEDIEFHRGVGPICLPPFSNINNDFAYNLVDVIGWGTIKFAGPLSPFLQKVTLMVTDNEACKNAFQDHVVIHPSQICTYDYTGTRKDSCQYDSGGPVIYRHKFHQFLVGIVSFGKDCGGEIYTTGVNVRITSNLEWIHANIENTNCYIEM